MKRLALILSLFALQASAADQPVETDPRLHSDGNTKSNFDFTDPANRHVITKMEWLTE